MEARELGASGVRVTRIVLGCGNFGGIGSAPELFGSGESREEAFAIMDAAWELGIRAFDTADAYGGGRVERPDPELPGRVHDRERLVLGLAVPEELGRRADAAEVPAAEDDPRHPDPASPEPPLLHRPILRRPT